MPQIGPAPFNHFATLHQSILFTVSPIHKPPPKKQSVSQVFLSYSDVIMPATATFNPTSCTLNITKKTDIEGSSILTQIDFEAKFQRVNGRSPTVIASAAAVLIKRALYHNGSFLSILDSHSDELQKFGVKFFDKNGKFRQDVYVNGEDEDSFHRGTGCWGKERELDSYDARIYFILDLAVTERASLRIKNDFLFFQSVPGSDEETLFKEVNRFTFNVS
ncbi:hypothetical protein ABKN59_008563 [Abortiporus biennis]